MNYSKVRVELWGLAILIWIMILIVVLSGCDQANQIISDPNTMPQIESGAEAAVTLTQILGTIWPALIPVGAAGGGILAAYKRLKPKIVESQRQGDKYYAAGETLAAILDDIKLNHPDIWEKMKPKITEVTKAGSDLENTIRGFRHLPPRTGGLV